MTELSTRSSASSLAESSSGLRQSTLNSNIIVFLVPTRSLRQSLGRRSLTVFSAGSKTGWQSTKPAVLVASFCTWNCAPPSTSTGMRVRTCGPQSGILVQWFMSSTVKSGETFSVTLARGKTSYLYPEINMGQSCPANIHYSIIFQCCHQVHSFLGRADPRTLYLSSLVSSTTCYFGQTAFFAHMHGFSDTMYVFMSCTAFRLEHSHCSSWLQNRLCICTSNERK